VTKHLKRLRLIAIAAVAMAILIPNNAIAAPAAPIIYKNDGIGVTVNFTMQPVKSSSSIRPTARTTSARAAR
jgi:hypothetical protein